MSEATCVCLEGVSGSAQGRFWLGLLKPGLSQHSVCGVGEPRA